MYKIAANINSLGTVIQNDILLNHFNGKTYKELSIEEKQLFNNYFNEKKSEIESQVNSISNNPQYISWVYELLMSKSLIFPEDIDKTRELLINYDEVKKSSNFPREYKEIFRFKSFGDLDNIIGKYLKSLSGRENAYEFGNNEVIYNKDGIQIVKLMDYDECIYLIENIAWCINKREVFNNYKPPFYMFVKDGKKYALLHFGSKQLKDIHDKRFERIDDNRFGEALKWIFEKNNIDITKIGLNNSNIIKDIILLNKDYEVLFDLLDNELKKRYTDFMINNGSYLSDKEFEYCDNEQKKKYIDYMINKGYYLSEKEFEYCDNEQKKKYIDFVINQEDSLIDNIFELCDNEQKKKYIDYRINKGLSLSPLQREYYNSIKIKASNSSNRLWNSYFNNNFIGKL